MILACIFACRVHHSLYSNQMATLLYTTLYTFFIFIFIPCILSYNANIIFKFPIRFLKSRPILNSDTCMPFSMLFLAPSTHLFLSLYFRN